MFQDISFNTDRLGEEKQKNTILRQLLEDFAGQDLNLKPSRVGTLDVIGNAYEYLIKNFCCQRWAEKPGNSIPRRKFRT